MQTLFLNRDGTWSKYKPGLPTIAAQIFQGWLLTKEGDAFDKRITEIESEQ